MATIQVTYHDMMNKLNNVGLYAWPVDMQKATTDNIQCIHVHVDAAKQPEEVLTNIGRHVQ